jgi:hypothetical protein
MQKSNHRHRRLLRPRRERPRGCRAAEKRDEGAPFIKKTRSHGMTAKGAGSAKRLRSAKDLPVSSSRVGRRPVSNSLDHLVGAGEHHRRHFQAKHLRHDQVNDEVEGRLLNPKIGPTGVENSYFS